MKGSKKLKLIIFIIPLAGVFLLISAYYFSMTYQVTALSPSQGDSLSVTPDSGASDVKIDTLNPAVTIQGIYIPVELVTSSTAIQKGLSGRKSLDKNEGMLFSFAKPDIYRFWMPDMHFPIDIIWISDNKIVDITSDIPIEFNPGYPIFYSPAEPAQYVLEVNAGFAKEKGIITGNAVKFNNIK